MKLTINSTVNNQQVKEKPRFVPVNYWFKYISLYLGDQLIETLNPDTYNIAYYYFNSAEEKNKTKNYLKINENINGWQVRIPLIFWFNNNPGLSLPLLAIPYIDFYLKFKIEKIGNIILNDLTNSKFSINPTISIQLSLDTILLDTPERILFGMYQHEYIIEKYTIYPTNFVHSINQQIPIKFTNLIKDIFLITQPVYNINDTCYKILSYERDYYYLDYLSNSFNMTLIEQEILINKSIRINLIKNNELLNKYELRFVLFLMDKYLSNILLDTQIVRLTLYFIHLYKNNVITKEKSPILNFNLQSNGNDLFHSFDQSYFNAVVPYQKFLNSVPEGYYNYSFSLNPLDKQYSGHTNFNYIDNVVVNLTSDSLVLTEPYNLKTIVKEYQILRFMSGLGSLAWTT